MRGSFAELAPDAATGTTLAVDRRDRRRAAERTTTLLAEPERVFEFEAFIDSITFLDRPGRERMKLAGGEIFDNLVRHARPLELDAIVVRATRHGDKPFLAFYFKSRVFAPYAACSDCGRVGPDAALDVDAKSLVDHPEMNLPFFDPIIGRWRGIGIHMCRYLSKSLLLRAGSRIDRIYIAF
jgi:hypothetical protein